MKYLKLYEAFEKYSFQNYMDWYGPSVYMENEINCNVQGLHTLNGLEKLNHIKSFSCANNYLTSLKGIENCIHLEYLNCSRNKLKDLEELKNLTKLTELNCDDNKLKNLNDILHLNLNMIYSKDNPLEIPLPKEWGDKFGYGYLYSTQNKIDFMKYEFQKEFLTKYPERVKDLEYFGFNEKIKEEFADLIEGNEFGFFNLK